MPAHLKMVTKGNFGQATIELDGQEIQRGVCALDLHLVAGEPNRATVELVAPSMEVEGEFEIRLPEETQALLKRLGWTPPD
jgi:hypothetical protein